MDNINTHVAMMNSSTTSSTEYVFGFVVVDNVVAVVVFQLYGLGVVRFRSFVTFDISVDIGSEMGL